MPSMAVDESPAANNPDRAPHVPKVVEAYIRLLQQPRARQCFLAAWFVCFVVGGALAMPFFNNCTNAFKPPPGSLADEADNQLDTYFPAIHKNLPNIVLVQAKKTGQFHEVVGNTTYTKAYNNLTADNGIALRKFTQAIQDRLGEFDHKEIIPPDGFTSYGSLVAAGYAPLVADQFLNDDHSATMITIMTSYGHTAITNEFVAYLDDAIEHALDRTGTRDLLEARQTGMGSWALDAITGMIGDMAKMDSIAFPLALGTLAYMIRSVRLMVLPCICIMVSLCTSMGVIMYPLSHAMQVIAFAPSVMMSATIAVSVDYSLFLLSRFREEILLGAEPMAAITTMLATAGHTVLVSGLTLVLSFSGLIFFPVNFLYSVGTGASIAVACSIACALNLCPCLMIQFIDFFGTVDPLPSCCRSCCPNKDKSATLQTGGSLQTALVVKDKELAEYESIHATAWFRISKVTLKNRSVVIGVLLAAAVPFFVLMFDLVETMDLSPIMPRDSHSWRTFEDLQTQFGAGNAMPNTLLVLPPAGTKVDRDFFQRSHASLKKLSELHTVDPSMPKATVTSMMYMSSNPKLEAGTSWLLYDITTNTKNCSHHPQLTKLFHGLCTANLTSFCTTNVTQLCQTYQLLASQFVSPNRDAAMARVVLDSNPLAPPGIKWLEHVRTDLPTGGLFTDRYYLTMGAVDLYDCKVVVYELLPLMTAITMAGVFMVVGVAFKSVVVPLRAVLTIAVTLAYIYGAAILVYQHGALDWLGFAPLASTGAVYWMNPCMVFSILVGLGLDYDIFLLSRVVEYREAGYTEEVAILYGLAKTGRIITAAGCIMALAFGGLLLSSEVAMNELAFYLVIGVLLDTFVIRTMLVPAIMVHLGKHNWWPRKLLPPTLGDSPPPSAATASSTTADVGALLDKGSNSAAADPYAAYRTGSE